MKRLGLALLLALALLAWLGPWLSPHDPRAQDLRHVLAAPDARHWLGTDHLGRDQFTRLAHALRLSLGLAAACTVLAAVVGSTLGLLAAWRGGTVDRLLSAVADAVMALPGLLLVLLVAALLPGELLPLYGGLALALWVDHFRIVRATAVPVLHGAPVEAARLLGLGTGHVLRRHLLPELAPLMGTLLAFGVATAVLSMAALGFVGVGLRPPTAELGLMLIELLPTYHEAPWLLAGPVAALMAFVAALALLAPQRGLP
jgi:peptide/nickel transport system permease protein